MKTFYLLLFFLAPTFLAQSQTKLYEDFEGADFPPEGWTITSSSSSGATWALNSDFSLGFVNAKENPYPAFEGQGSMVYETNNVTASAWAITPAVSLVSGVAYTISFYYRVANADFPEKMKVTVGNDATIQAQTDELWDNNGGSGLNNETSWTRASVNYTPSANGNFYFGFNCYSDANGAALVVDNIKVEVAPTAAPPCPVLLGPADNAIDISAPQALFTWDSAATASEYIFRFGTTANPTDVSKVTGTSINQSDIEYNKTYYWSVVPENAIGAATGCAVYSFTTMEAPPIPANDNCDGAIDITPGATITASTKSATQSLPAQVVFGATGDANDDVWFKFTPLQSGSTTITLKPDLIFDGVITAYEGNCNSLDSLSCADAGFDGVEETLILPDLVAGHTYYFRVYGYGDAGKDGSFSLTVSGTTLPVNVSSFKGRHNGLQNDLSWTTVTEQNNKGFELQRSTNGKDFATIEFIKAKSNNGNGSSALTYAFTDAKPLAGKNYYRLKQLDKDGRSTISGIVLLENIASNTFAISNVYPNPAKSAVNVVLRTPVATNVTIFVTDVAGMPVMQQSVKLTGGETKLSLNVNNLPSGNYVLKTISTDGKQTAISRFVKQ